MLEVRRDDAQLAQRPRLELADALAGDAEAAADLLERPRLLAVEAEAEREHVAHARVQRLECRGKLGRAEVRRRRLVRLLGVGVLDQVAVEALAVAHRRLERDRILDEVEQLLDALLGETALLGELGDRRVAVELLREDPPGAHHAAHLLGDVHRQADRAALVGERPRDGLADPPGRVRRELEPMR